MKISGIGQRMPTKIVKKKKNLKINSMRFNFLQDSKKKMSKRNKRDNKVDNRWKVNNNLLKDSSMSNNNNSKVNNNNHNNSRFKFQRKRMFKNSNQINQDQYINQKENDIILISSILHYKIIA